MYYSNGTGTLSEEGGVTDHNSNQNLARRSSGFVLNRTTTMPALPQHVPPVFHANNGVDNALSHCPQSMYVCFSKIFPILC